MTEEARAFLQHRVARAGLFGGLLLLGFLLLRVVMVLTAAESGTDSASFYLHLGAALLSLTPWVVCRRGVRSAALIHALEFAALIGLAVAMVLMGSYIPVDASPHLIVVLCLTHLLVARAVYVPSSGRRTLLLGAIVGAIASAATYPFFLDAPPALLAYFRDTYGLPDAPALAAVTTQWAVSWWLATIAVTTACSRVIYGLRRQVEDVRELGQYTLERKLGEGGMGVVYRARHAMLRRPTAVKLLQPDKAGELAIERFEREVQLTARLTHPNTVTIYDYGRTPDGIFYYAMELLDGATLGDVVDATGPQPPERVARILADCAGALAEAHDVGLIHRDIKPTNIMLVKQGGVSDVAKLLDFGLVKEVVKDPATALTVTQGLVGTPMYLAPEAVADPAAVDGRSDLYALGAVGYFLLTGEHVFEGKTVMDVCLKHLQVPPVAPSTRLGAPVPAGLESLVLACLAKDPLDRPQTAAELLGRLHALEGLPPWDGAWWWEEFAHVVAAPATERDPTGDSTIAIDLARRGSKPPSSRG